jgi:hypothetical protein
MLINDAGHWRQRAERARALAKEMNDFGATVALLKIADDYDRLARRTEERRRPRNPTPSPSAIWQANAGPGRLSP